MGHEVQLQEELIKGGLIIELFLSMAEPLWDCPHLV